ncbi:MAG: OmpA family protein [Candidatus Cyclobacteriaceae bacterium M3_2C_046]
MAKKEYYLLFVIIFLQISINKLHAQDDPKEQAKMFVEIADEAYKANLALDLVREQYQQGADLDPQNLRANFMTGELYIQRGPNKERSTQYLLRVLEHDPDYRFDILYKIGQGYQYGLDFDNAIVFFNRYKEKLMSEGKDYRGEDKIPLFEIERRILECENGKKYVANPEDYAIVNVGNLINSDAYDFAPVLNEDETMMIFTTRRQDGNTNENVDTDNYYFEDIYISRQEGGQWSLAKNIGSVINTENHDSNLAISADGQTLYIYRDENGGDIYYSDRQKDGNWSEPEPLTGNINSSYFENAVTINNDKNVLFFSSDRPGGLGGSDIYMSIIDSKGNWSKVTNVGPVINTEFDDEGPFIDYDGKTLYFSSRGHDGMGGFDIYKSEYDSAMEEWETPINLGYPINTPDDDVYFVSTKGGKRGYYSSVKDDGMGYTDIYMVTLPDLSHRNKNKVAAKKDETEEVIKKEEKKNLATKEVNQAAKPEFYPLALFLKVEDKSNGQAMDAKITLKNTQNNIQIPTSKISTGIYKMDLMVTEDTEFMLSAEKAGYVFVNTKITVPAATEPDRELKRRFEMMKFEVGAHDVLRNIYFNFGQWSFTNESYNELNKLERMLFENPSFVIEISGHTDNIGEKPVNKNLSQMRANAVVDYLTNKGINRQRLRAEGYGEEKPLASNDDEKDGRELNRRVEFTVLEKGI